MITWSKSIIVVGDTNIDVSKISAVPEKDKEITDSYQYFLLAPFSKKIWSLFTDEGTSASMLRSHGRKKVFLTFKFLRILVVSM